MINVTMQGGIALVTMTHGKANALDIEFCDALAKQVKELVRPEVRAVVLTGQGGIFSAGVDLRRIGADGADYVRAFLPTLHRLYEALFFLEKPVVAAINGHAIAGGAVLAACADRRVMARGNGRVGITELLVGVPFPALAFEIVRFALPPRHLAISVYSGEICLPDEALRRGWIDEIVEPGALMARAMAVANELTALSPAAFTMSKQQIRRGVGEEFARLGAATDEKVTAIWTAPETLARIRDFVARTLKAK